MAPLGQGWIIPLGQGWIISPHRAVVPNAVFFIIAGSALLCPVIPGASAQTTESRCLAIAQAAPKTIPVAYVHVQEGLVAPVAEEVSIRFIGHSTFLITSPRGVTIATDYNDYAGPGVTPRVITMNRAHTSHYTDTPDPDIEYVLRGWNPEGGKAVHHVQVDDVLIRNVTTDIRYFGGRIEDGNSIFIFEVAKLCIGHLGHLHHVLALEDLGVIGQLDVVMVPVDGGYTMEQAAMVETLKVLRARLILPMHYFGMATLNRFLLHLEESFEVELSQSPELIISVKTLPQSPKVIVLPGP
jgi:L-ascorbate metabolism protein UlaG (beta-lactamase superfamily)